MTSACQLCCCSVDSTKQNTSRRISVASSQFRACFPRSRPGHQSLSTCSGKRDTWAPIISQTHKRGTLTHYELPQTKCADTCRHHDGARNIERIHTRYPKRVCQHTHADTQATNPRVPTRADTCRHTSNALWWENDPRKDTAGRPHICSRSLPEVMPEALSLG